METFDDLYLKYDGAIPDPLCDIAKAGDRQTYTRQIAHAAERQFQRIIEETQVQIRHYRTLREPIFSPATLRHLSHDLLYHRNRAIEAYIIVQKNMR